MFDIGDTQKVVSLAWSEFLGQKVGCGDDLLSMGAHSLMMALVADRIKVAIGVAVPIDLCFEAPLLEDYAAEIHRLRSLNG